MVRFSVIFLTRLFPGQYSFAFFNFESAASKSIRSNAFSANSHNPSTRRILEISNAHFLQLLLLRSLIVLHLGQLITNVLPHLVHVTAVLSEIYATPQKKH